MTTSAADIGRQLADLSLIERDRMIRKLVSPYLAGLFRTLFLRTPVIPVKWNAE